MKPRVLICAVAVAVLAFFVVPGAAQEMTAEVRTWGGQSWHLAQPSLELFYTVVAKPEEASAPASPGGERRSLVGGNEVPLMFGTKEALSSSLEKKDESRQGQRQSEIVTFRVARVETKVPLANIRSLAFFRQPVSKSPLPPYFSQHHFRYSASAVLTDGSRMDADYVNFGTAVLRGMTPGGRVDIPWQEIEVVHFSR